MMSSWWLYKCKLLVSVDLHKVFMPKNSGELKSPSDTKPRHSVLLPRMDAQVMLNYCVENESSYAFSASAGCQICPLEWN